MSDRTSKSRERAEAVEAAEAELLQSYGGNLALVERSAVRLMARLSVRINDPRPGDDPIKLSEQLSRLSALLPAKPVSPPADLSRLNEAELNALEKLIRKANGEDVEPISLMRVELVGKRWNLERLSAEENAELERLRVKAGAHELALVPKPARDTRRHYLAVDLAEKLDAMPAEMSSTDKAQVAGLISGLLYPFCTHAGLVGPMLAGAPGRGAGGDGTAAALPAPEATPAVPSAAMATNIVPITETLAERKARLEVEMGARMTPHSYPVTAGDSDDPFGRGAGRFDNLVKGPG